MAAPAYQLEEVCAARRAILAREYLTLRELVRELREHVEAGCLACGPDVA